MLYDPRWEVKADPFTLEDLIDWLEQQPAHMEYNWQHPRKCLLGKWARSHGFRGRALGMKSVELGFHNETFARVALGWGPHTFGAALERAKALLPSC